jgi:hypothetical protein
MNQDLQTRRIAAGLYEYRGFTIRKRGRSWVYAHGTSTLYRKADTILGATLRIDRALKMELGA